MLQNLFEHWRKTTQQPPGVKFTDTRRGKLVARLKAGYSAADIDALQDNDAARDRLRAEIRRDLAARGATGGQASGYCAVGREEIAKGSQAGKLLRAK